MVEVLLGLTHDERLTYNKAPFDIVFDETKRAELKEAEVKPSLLQLINDWLERTPFLETPDFNFVEAYKGAVQSMLAKEKAAIMATDLLSGDMKQKRLQMLGDTDSYFASVLDPVKHARLLEEGSLKLSYKATIAALLIHLYREEPILQLPYQLLSTMMDIEENFTTWRYRHAQMVLRMIGRNRLSNVVHQHCLTGLGRGYDQAALTFTKWCNQVDHARRNVFGTAVAALHSHALIRMQRCQVLKSDLVACIFGRVKIDLINLEHREIALTVLRRPDLARYGIAGTHVKASYLAG